MVKKGQCDASSRYGWPSNHYEMPSSLRLSTESVFDLQKPFSSFKRLEKLRSKAVASCRRTKQDLIDIEASVSSNSPSTDVMHWVGCCADPQRICTQAAAAAFLPGLAADVVTPRSRTHDAVKLSTLASVSPVSNAALMLLPSKALWLRSQDISFSVVPRSPRAQ